VAFITVANASASFASIEDSNLAVDIQKGRK